MLHDGRLAVHDFAGVRDCAAECGEDALLAHADSQDGDFAGKVEDCGGGDARVGEGVAWAGGDDEFGGVEGDELVERDFVVAVGGDGGDAEGHDVLYDIVGETTSSESPVE